MALWRAMLIDPDPELGGLLTERLNEHDIDVITTADGIEGFALAKRIKPHIVIQELALPDISGFFLLEKLRTTENTFSVPVVVLTHRRGAEIEPRAMNGGATAFLQKPYNVKTFIPLVRSLISKPMDKESLDRAWKTVKPTASYRLVTERLEVEIRTEHHLMRGLTSGINENGVGAHMNVLEKMTDDPPPLSTGQPCTIFFRSIKYPLMPCSGEVLRIEESWDRRYRQFIAIKFLDEDAGGMMDSDRMSLREWIRDQM